MKEYKLQHKIRTMDIRAFESVTPSCSQVDKIISEECAITYNGQLIAVYRKADFDLSDVRTACLGLQIQNYKRTNGIMTKTMNINAKPRNPQRTNKCTHTWLHDNKPSTHKIFIECAQRIAIDYRKYFAQAYAGQVKQTYVGDKKVYHQYRIKRTPFTGGVINYDTALPYHKDMANTKDGISCMLILKKGVAGGELILPELKLGFACQDGYVLLFDGQKYIHGVTPIVNPLGGNGYRYTIVYYNNKGMHLCLPQNEENLRYRDYTDKQNYKKYRKAKML